jgi:hypothetical protein
VHPSLWVPETELTGCAATCDVPPRDHRRVAGGPDRRARADGRLRRVPGRRRRRRRAGPADDRRGHRRANASTRCGTPAAPSPTPFTTARPSSPCGSSTRPTSRSHTSLSRRAVVSEPLVELPGLWHEVPVGRRASRARSSNSRSPRVGPTDVVTRGQVSAAESNPLVRAWCGAARWSDGQRSCRCQPPCGHVRARFSTSRRTRRSPTSSRTSPPRLGSRMPMCGRSMRRGRPPTGFRGSARGCWCGRVPGQQARM